MGNVKKSKEQIKAEQRQRGLNTYRKNGLKPLTEQPPEIALEIRRKGQRAMMESKAKKRTIKEVMEMVTGLDVSNIATEYVNPEIVSKAEQIAENITAYDLIGLAQLQKAIEGNVKSAEFIRDSNGEKPKEVKEIDVDIITENDRAMLHNINERLDNIEGKQADIIDV